jgi:NADH-quinone oxidoreductase subunit K
MIMADVNMMTGLIVAGILFIIGLVGVLARRDIIFVLLSIEIMLNACGLAFIVVGSALNQPDGQVMYFFILSVAAAEMAIGLGLILNFYHKYKTLDTNALNRMRG